MAALDPRIEEIRKKYDLQKDDFWELPQKKGTWVAKHAALEMAAVKAGIEFLPPQVLEADGAAKSAALCVTGTMTGRSEWSVGEASPANNKNAYPFAMAEKRAKDRVILKLIGLHGLIYSEEEADDFKRGPAPNPTPQPEGDDVDEGVKNWVATQKTAITKCGSLPTMYQWLAKAAGDAGTITDPDSGSHLDRLKRKSAEAYGEITRAFQTQLMEINRKENK